MLLKHAFMKLDVGEDSRMKRHTAQWREAEPEMWWQPRQVWTCGSMATADKGACGLRSGLVLRLPGGSDHHPLGPCKNLGLACGMEPRCCCCCAYCSPFCKVLPTGCKQGGRAKQVTHPCDHPAPRETRIYPRQRMVHFSGLCHQRAC